MAKQPKQGLDYFSIDAGFFTDMKVRRIKRACGPAAVSILICLMCNIYREGGYYLGWDKDSAFLIAEETGVSEDEITRVVDTAVSIGFFDGELFKFQKILTSNDIQRHFIFVVKSSKLKRDAVKPEYNLIINPEEKPVSPEEKAIAAEEKPVSTEESTHRIEKNRIEKNKIEKESKENPASGEIPRAQLGEFGNVDLSGRELAALTERYGAVKTADYINRVSTHMRSRDKAYPDHYAVIIKWIEEDKNKAPPPKPAAAAVRTYARSELSALVTNIDELEF